MRASAAETIRPEIRDQILGLCFACSSRAKRRYQLRLISVPQIGRGLFISSPGSAQRADDGLFT